MSGAVLADAQVANLEQPGPGPLRDRVAAGQLHVAVLLRGLFEDFFDLLNRLIAVLPLQSRKVLLAVKPRELLRQVGLLLAQIEPLQAVVQEVSQRQARRRPHGPVRVVLQDRAEERFVLLAEAVGDALTERAELVAADVVALDEFDGFGACGVFAHKFDRPRSGVHLPDRLNQSVQRDRIVGVLLGQFQELQRKLVTAPERLTDELQPLRVGQGDAAARRPVIILKQRLILLRWGGRFVLSVAEGRPAAEVSIARIPQIIRCMGVPPLRRRTCYSAAELMIMHRRDGCAGPPRDPRSDPGP